MVRLLVHKSQDARPSPLRVVIGFALALMPLTLIVEDAKGQKESIKVDAPVRSLTATDGHGEHSMHDHSHM